MISYELFSLLNFEAECYEKYDSNIFLNVVANIVFPRNINLDKLVDLMNTLLAKEKIIPRVRVKNLTFSMQASSIHYCSPKCDEGPWKSVELGALNFKPPRWILKYAEDGSNYANTVYGFVPIIKVARLIKKLQEIEG